MCNTGRSPPGQPMWCLWRSKWHWNTLFSGFPLSISFHRSYILIYYRRGDTKPVGGRSSRQSYPTDMSNVHSQDNNGRLYHSQSNRWRAWFQQVRSTCWVHAGPVVITNKVVLALPNRARHQICPGKQWPLRWA
jgi:hypothetical protein